MSVDESLKILSSTMINNIPYPTPPSLRKISNKTNKSISLFKDNMFPEFQGFFWGKLFESYISYENMAWIK